MSERRSGGTIEQLHYTWAPRGAEGMNQFQISAISAGLRQPPLARLLSDLRRLCRYDHPPSSTEESPASFGWLDIQERRIAFLRVPTQRISGRSGNFAAHVLIGERAAMPAAEIATSFGAEFWWTGLTEAELEEIAAGKQDFELPPLDWDEALAMRVEPGADATEAAGRLASGLLSLADGERLAVVDRGSGFGSALRAIGWHFPEALGGISLSTYESVAVFPFTVVGTRERPAGMRICELASEDDLSPDCRVTARELLGDRPESKLLRTVVSRFAAPGQGGSVSSRWEVARALVGLADGRELDPGPVATMADPDAVAYLAHTEAGRERLADAVIQNPTQPLRALRSARERIPDEHLHGLCLAFRRRYATDGELGGCAGVLSTLPPGPAREELEDGLLGVALRAGSAGTRVGPEDSVALVRIAAARGMDADGCRPLLRRAARHVGACAEDFAIPDSAVSAMLSLALKEPGAQQELCRALRRRPRLLAAVPPGLDEQERWLTLGLQLPPTQLQEALPALLAGLARQPRRELSALVRRAPERTGRRALVAAGNLFDSATLPLVLADLCEERAVSALIDGEFELARSLLAHGSSSDGQLAGELLARLSTSTSGCVWAASRAGEIQSATLRTTIFDTAVDRALRGLRYPDEVGGVWALLASAHAGENEEVTLERLLDRAMRVPPASGQGVLLLWLGADLLPSRPELRKRRGRPRSRTVNQLIAALAKRASEAEIERMEAFAKAGDRRAARWWKGLVANRRKALRRRSG